ncbi:dihydrolipoamide acetyltransferase component of pyruvate dehydrogenase complex [Hydrogenimonas sp.]|nr:dihydrolipoamide acetyltransferase component of pyruvate dehydrogenase complex [Hydrogenimonas sp.]
MDYEIVMPQLSASMEEGRLVNWKVHPGDSVKAGDVIAEVESDKAVMDVQSFKDGTVKELKVSEGESVPVGSVIAVLQTEGGKEAPEKEKKEEPEAVHEAPKSAPPKKEKPRKKEEAPESVVEELFGGASASKESKTGPTTEKRAAVSAGEASPKARALAAGYAIDIEALQKEGSLPLPAHEEDIKEWYLRRRFTPKALKLVRLYALDPAIFDKAGKIGEEDVEKYVKEHEIPLPKPVSTMKKAIISTVEEAAKKPVYHIFDRIDAALLKIYENRELTYTVWFLKLFAEAMMKHEGFRTTLKDEKLFVWPNASISLAIADGEDLYAAVFKDLNRKSVEEISAALAEMKRKIASKRVRPEDLAGSTFGLSNLGMTGIERFDAMINRDDSAIAAIGAEVDGRISVTLTVDHRVVNGLQAALFMESLKTLAVDRRFFERAKEGGD